MVAAAGAVAAAEAAKLGENAKPKPVLDPKIKQEAAAKGKNLEANLLAKVLNNAGTSNDVAGTAGTGSRGAAAPMASGVLSASRDGAVPPSKAAVATPPLQVAVPPNGVAAAGKGAAPGGS